MIANGLESLLSISLCLECWQVPLTTHVDHSTKRCPNVASPSPDTGGFWIEHAGPIVKSDVQNREIYRSVCRDRTASVSAVVWVA